jgi:acyl dehydratase
VALNLDSVGKTFSSPRTYVVGREKVREFARAVGETSALCHDLEAAKAAGYADVIAPVTFPITITLEIMGESATSPEVGLNWSRVVHGDQRFKYERAVVAGDELSVTTTIEEIKAIAGNHMITLRGDVYAADKSLVAQVWTGLVERGESA